MYLDFIAGLYDAFWNGVTLTGSVIRIDFDRVLPQSVWWAQDLLYQPSLGEQVLIAKDQPLVYF